MDKLPRKSGPKKYTDLNDINARLQEILSEMPETQRAYSEAQGEFERRKWEIYTGSAVAGLRNQEMREAYVSSVLEEEGLTDTLVRARSRAKNLQFEVEVLTTISQNLRSLTRQ